MMSVRKAAVQLGRDCQQVAAAASTGSRRKASTTSSTAKSSTPPKRTVFISQSCNVFANLAMEEWLYRNWSFERRSVLFLWRNAPCVVIGKHQNPFVEANLPYLEAARVPVARRNSGGGAVYHDHGNLNCTFFTSRDRYDRGHNLELICRVLQRDFQVEARPSPRDDIVLQHDFKVSGSAAKLGRQTAYHHCSLLVGADKQQLKLALQGDRSIQSKATSSLPSPIMNLSEVNADITVEKMMNSVGRLFLEQQEASAGTVLANGFTLVNPSDDWFPGLGALEAELSSPEWLHNRTPRFSITRPVTLPPCLAHNTTLSVSIQVYHGRVEEVRVPAGTCGELEEVVREVGASLRGLQYYPHIFTDLTNKLRLTQPPQPQRSVI